MRRIVLNALLVAVVLPIASTQAADFEEYGRLVSQADAAHEALEGASEALRPAMQTNALERDIAVIEWLETFFATDEFDELPEAQQQLAYQDRYRNEYNASRLLIELDRCEEARDRVRTLLDSSVDDPELRPRLTEAYDQALSCVNRPRVATLLVEASPGDAQLIIDGEFVGLASRAHEVPLGEHTLRVQAEGHVAEELAFVAEREGDTVEMGPINLVEIIDEDAFSPTWYEWTLWGVGLAGVGSGLGLYLAGSSRQSDLDAIIADPTQEPEDPEGEQDRIDTLKLTGIILGGVGLAAGITGTVLYFVRKGSRDDGGGEQVGWAPLFVDGGGGVLLSFDL